MNHAGQLFSCACCKGEFDESLARFDNDLQAPVCAACDLELKDAKLWMAREGIKPSIKPWHYRNRGQQPK